MNKTAMQEFFMVLKEFNKELYNTMYNEGILDTAIEKEKEQIIEAYGRAISMFYESEQPEEYYNERFNNLHIVTDGKVGLSSPDETTNNELNVNQNK
jgi:hypothetical protein